MTARYAVYVTEMVDEPRLTYSRVRITEWTDSLEDAFYQKDTLAGILNYNSENLRVLKYSYVLESNLS